MDILNSFGLDPSSYSIAIHLFVRLLGILYIIAYVPFLFQIRGLIGKDGIRPVREYLNVIKYHFGDRRFYYVPTLLWLNASDRALLLLISSGVIFGACLALGIYPAIILVILYAIHLSLSSAGQEFLGFGWEAFLIELTIGAFLLVAVSPLNVFGWIGLNFLLFRFHIQAGISKIFSHDKSWRDLTALSYHYLTQPLPNTIAWYFHKLPLWFHKLSVCVMFYIELVVPFLIFAPPEMRLAAFVQLVGFQIGIWFTGNLSYLNHLTVVACVILLHNRFLEPFFEVTPVATPSPVLWQVVISVLGAAFLLLQLVNLWQTFFPNHWIRRLLIAVEPFYISQPHGIFAVMTTKRYEIVVEGSLDGEEWKEYEFRFKPGDVKRRPHRVSPYQPRLDWQAWFLPFASYQRQVWFQQFLVRLLQGSEPVLKLLKHNPFHEKPPIFIRALMYDYEFTTAKEKRETGAWWKRKLMGAFSPTMHLSTPEERE